MKCIYEAANSLEGHMILNLIEQEGLTGRVDGEYLQGGMGELPAMGLVRVMVADENFEQARRIVKEWDSTQVKAEKSRTVPTGGKLGTGLFGFVCGSLITVFFYTTPVTTDGIDYDGDGRLDERWTYVSGRISKTEMDRNLDGNVDFIYRFDRKGLVHSAEADQDFNGAFETISSFYRGNILSTYSDTTGDGFKDYREHFKQGILDRIEFRDPGSKRPVRIKNYSTFKLESAEVDANKDGILDTLYRYDNLENVISESPILPQ